MQVVGYARVSSERQAEKELSIPAQLKALRKYALKQGWEVVGEYVDEAESAKTANRPKFKEMISAAKRKNKPFEAILVWKHSRFARSREDSIIYKSLLRKCGVRVISINEPIDDSAAGKLLEGMIEVIDEFYSSNLAEDVLNGMAENAARGFFNGGPVPFGYRVVKVNVGNVQKSKLEFEEMEAPTAKRVFQMALAGEGGKEISKALNRDGLLTRKGKLWGKTTIYKMLRNEVYTGALVWTGKNGKVIRVTGTHPAVVSREDFDKIQQTLAERGARIRHPRTVNSRYLLSSLLYCAQCGAPMIGCAAKSGQFAYYRCNHALRHDPNACQSGWIPQNKIEGFVIDQLKDKVLTDDNLGLLVKMVNEEISLKAGQTREQLEQIEKRLESVQQKLLKYFTSFEKGVMTEEDAAPRIRELRAEQTILQRAKDVALADLEDDEPQQLDSDQILNYVMDLKDLLSKGSLMQQRTFLRSFIRRIEFTKGQLSVKYTVPLPSVGKEKGVKQEVLSIGSNGGR